jgi:DNA-binding response OmpR family regulator
MTQPSAVIIDDEPDTTTYLTALLSDHGWRVRSANRADEGLALLAQDRPDVLLLDLMMPDRGGLSVLVAVRKDSALAGLRVVVVSGIQQTVTADYHAFLGHFKHFHPDAYLDKPIDAQQLLATLEALTAGGTAI